MNKIEGFTFERPVKVYAELYNGESAPVKEKGVIFSLAISFFLVITLALLLRSVEYALNFSSADWPKHLRLPSMEAPASFTEYMAQGLRVFIGIETAEAKTIEPSYAAKQYSKVKEIEMMAGERKEIKIGFYNQGRYNWRNHGQNFVSVYTFKPKYRQSLFFDNSWFKKNQPVKLEEVLAGPGQLGYFEFYLKAPVKPGVYKETFALAAENKAWISDGEFELIITVKEKEGESVASSNNQNQVKQIPPPITELKEGVEPRLRLGLFTTENAILFSSPYDYEVKDAGGQTIAFLKSGETATVNFNKEIALYSLEWPNGAATSSLPLRFEPTVEISYLVLENFDSRLRWKNNLNNNKFRGILEVRFNQKTDRLWLINELPLEYYLKGLAETADENRPPEFLKALAVAARSFTYYHLQNKVKHQAEDFDLEANVDQVYRGYAFEEQAPWWSDAVSATQGQMVTYSGEAAFTPYFARSSGRTRSFKEVWGGTGKPWLVSVKTPYDRGLSRLGHGVGMSLYDARTRAGKGASFEEILKYYYQGTDIGKKY